MTRKTALHCAFFLLSLCYAWMMVWVVAPRKGEALQGLVLNRPSYDKPQWVTITEAQAESGATIPAGTNVLIHLPPNMATTLRSVLFGRSGVSVRYWGYCFPEETGPDTRKPGLPGKVFLSEAERAWRARRAQEKLPTYSIYRPPHLDSSSLSDAALRTIRHQLERFQGGMTCYVMTARELPFGTDQDADGLNARIERQYGSDRLKADTDEDGINDGAEVQLGTDPIRRDSDGDGLVDGLEDRNRNGVIEPGETDPRNRDSDHDGLCDGNCRITGTKRVCRELSGYDCVNLPYARWEGEDKNLNGITDNGELDPRLLDTDGDGVLDDQEYFNCVLQHGSNC